MGVSRCILYLVPWVRGACSLVCFAPEAKRHPRRCTAICDMVRGERERLLDTGDLDWWFTSVDSSASRGCILSCDNRGHLWIFDLLGVLQNCVRLGSAKLQHLEVCPGDGDLLATASNGKEVALWDIRRLPTHTAAFGAESAKSAPTASSLARFKLDSIPSSARFSPGRGDTLLVTTQGLPDKGVDPKVTLIDTGRVSYAFAVSWRGLCASEEKATNSIGNLCSCAWGTTRARRLGRFPTRTASTST